MTSEEITQLLEQALLTALPYVEDVLDNPEQLACFKRGVVQRDVKQIRKALQSYWDTLPPTVYTDELPPDREIIDQDLEEIL